MPITEPIDEDELEADLAALEQENLDEKMLKTGTMPVADSLNRLPQAANGERKSRLLSSPLLLPLSYPILSCQLSGWKKRKRKRKHRLTSHDTFTQSKGNQKRRSKKKTRRRSCGSCRRRWPCERASGTRRIRTERNRIFCSFRASFFLV